MVVAAVESRFSGGGIEKDIRGQSPKDRRTARQAQSRPVTDEFETWLAAKSPLGEALIYTAKYWEGLCLFLTDDRIEIDSNAPHGECSTHLSGNGASALSALSP